MLQDLKLSGIRGNATWQCSGLSTTMCGLTVKSHYHSPADCPPNCPSTLTQPKTNLNCPTEGLDLNMCDVWLFRLYYVKPRPSFHDVFCQWDSTVHRVYINLDICHTSVLGVNLILDERAFTIVTTLHCLDCHLCHLRIPRDLSRSHLCLLSLLPMNAWLQKNLVYWPFYKINS